MLAKCIEMYFDEYIKCVICIADFLMVKLEVRNERPLGLVLWDNYCSLADNLLTVRVNVEGRESSELVATRKKCREYVLSRKIKVFMYLVRLFHRAVSNDESIAD